MKPLNESAISTSSSATTLYQSSVYGNEGKLSGKGIPDDQKVRVLRVDEYKEAAMCLAEAFKDDHTTDYFINTPDRADWTEEQKWDLHVSMMEYITYAHCLKGLATTVGPDYGAVALW